MFQEFEGDVCWDAMGTSCYFSTNNDQKVLVCVWMPLVENMTISQVL